MAFPILMAKEAVDHLLEFTKGISQSSRVMFSKFELYLISQSSTFLSGGLVGYHLIPRVFCANRLAENTLVHFVNSVPNFLENKFS